MTKEELLKALKGYEELSKYAYVAHARAIKSLLRYIDDPEITKAFEEVREVNYEV